jgi:PilZ domain
MLKSVPSLLIGSDADGTDVFGRHAHRDPEPARFLRAQGQFLFSNMSRGGLGFRTKNAYAISTEVTVAVPLSPESPPAPALYVPARVVNIAELPELKTFRCGVAFLPVAGMRLRS